MPLGNLFAAEVETYRVGEMLSQLNGCESLLGPSRTCVCMGYGGQRRHIYQDLSQQSDIDVLWSGPFLPWWASPLGLGVASWGGLVVCRGGRSIPLVFQKLAHLAMVELYSFTSPLLADFQPHVLKYKWRSRPSAIIHRDESYFCFAVDGDHMESKTGIAVRYSYGPSCPSELTQMASSWEEFTKIGTGSH